jgi:hypothetical protein
MKWLVARGSGILVMLLVMTTALMVSGSVFHAEAKEVRKEWKFGRSEWRNWEQQPTDRWGGLNYWCIKIPGNQCNLYDWLAVYWVPDVDPCPQINNSEYGDAMVAAAAAEYEITLPEGLFPSTFEMTIIE